MVRVGNRAHHQAVRVQGVLDRETFPQELRIPREARGNARRSKLGEPGGQTLWGDGNPDRYFSGGVENMKLIRTAAEGWLRWNEPEKWMELTTRKIGES